MFLPFRFWREILEGFTDDLPNFLVFVLTRFLGVVPLLRGCTLPDHYFRFAIQRIKHEFPLHGIPYTGRETHGRSRANSPRITSGGVQSGWLYAIETCGRRDPCLEAFVPRTCMIEKIEVWIGGVLDDTFGGQFLSYSAHDLLVEDLVILRMSYRNQVILYPRETFQPAKVVSFRPIGRDLLPVGRVGREQNGEQER